MSSTTKSSSVSATTKSLLLQRGSNDSTPFSRTFFVLLRALDLPLQYAILSSRSLAAPLIQALGWTAIPPTGRSVFLMGTNTGLSPQRAILFGMAIGSFAKHSYWVTAISQEPMSPAAAGMISVFHSFLNTLNSIFFTSIATSTLSYPAVDGNGTRLSIQTIVGISLYTLGMILEWGSEMQRLRFKKDLKNKGRVYTRGLFGFARHINYGGYIIWRTGYAITAAGWTWGAVMGGALTLDFVKNNIPELDDYCSKRYSEQWVQYKRAVPYKLFPFIL